MFVYKQKNKMAAESNVQMVKSKTMPLLLPFLFLPGIIKVIILATFSDRHKVFSVNLLLAYRMRLHERQLDRNFLK